MGSYDFPSLLFIQYRISRLVNLVLVLLSLLNFTVELYFIFLFLNPFKKIIGCYSLC